MTILAAGDQNGRRRRNLNCTGFTRRRFGVSKSAGVERNGLSSLNLVKGLIDDISTLAGGPVC